MTATHGRLLFDPATGALLEGPKGLVIAQGPVGSAYELPPGVRPVDATGGPAPPTLKIFPPAGDPKTIFKLLLAPTASHP